MAGEEIDPPMAEYNLTVAEVGGIPRLALEGYLNAASAAEILATVEEHLAQGRVNIILDLAHCTTINSLGATGLIDLGVTIKEEYAGRFFLAGVPPFLRHALDLMGVFNVAESAGTVEEAVESCPGEPCGTRGSKAPNRA